MATIEARKSRGKTVYRVKVRLRGYPPADATFDRMTDAKRWAAETEADMRAGRWFDNSQLRRTTLGDLIGRYLTEYLPTSGIASIPSKLQRLGYVKDAIGHMPLADVTTATVVEMRAKLMIGRAPATVNKYLADLRHVYNIARMQFAIEVKNPVSDVEKLKEPRGRVRHLEPDEAVELLRACGAHSPALKTIVTLALSTGARRGELLNLRWSDVDLVSARLTFQQTKNGERRTAPLVGSALEAMRIHSKVRRLDTDLVFPGETGKPLEIGKAFPNACKRAGIDNFTFHDLRHTAASWIAMNGGTLAEIAEVLGHKTLSMVKRYSHLTEGHTRGVLERTTSRMMK